MEVETNKESDSHNLEEKSNNQPNPLVKATVSQVVENDEKKVVVQ